MERCGLQPDWLASDRVVSMQLILYVHVYFHANALKGLTESFACVLMCVHYGGLLAFTLCVDIINNAIQMSKCALFMDACECVSKEERELLMQPAQHAAQPSVCLLLT